MSLCYEPIILLVKNEVVKDFKIFPPYSACFDVRTQLQQSLLMHEGNVDYLATTKSHQLIYPMRSRSQPRLMGTIRKAFGCS